MSETSTHFNQPNTAQCDGCGLATNEPGLLKTRRKSFRSKKVKLCTACQVDSLKYAQRTNWVILGVCAAIIVALGLLNGNAAITLYFLMLLAALFVFSPVSVAIHELGHAIVAKAVNWQVCGIMMGYGRLLWQGRAGDALLQIRFIQMGGLTWCSPKKDSPIVPVQAFVIFAAGPVMNAVAAWIGWLFYEPHPFHPVTNLSYMTITGVWIFLNVYNLAISLLPYKLSLAGLSLGSDGYQMLQAIFGSSALRSRYVYGHCIMRFSSLRQFSEMERAHQAITEHLRSYPDDILGLQCLSAAECELKNYEKCMELAQRGIELLEQGVEVHPAVMSGQTPMFRKMLEAAFQCNLAYSMLKGNVENLEEEALHLAQRAYDTVPWSPAIQNTYGYALARNGQVVEGLKYLKISKAKLRDEPYHVRREVHEMIAEVEALMNSCNR